MSFVIILYSLKLSSMASIYDSIPNQLIPINKSSDPRLRISKYHDTDPEIIQYSLRAHFLAMWNPVSHTQSPSTHICGKWKKRKRLSLSQQRLPSTYTSSIFALSCPVLPSMMIGLWAVNLHMDKRLAANRLVSLVCLA